MNEEIKIVQPLYLEKPKMDEASKSYNLTINAILNKNNGVGEAVEIQDKILENINAQSLIGSNIYKYPANTIHFSIINFKVLNSKLDSKDKFEEKRKSYIEKIKEIFKTFDNKKIVDKKVRFSYIYTKKSPSISLQAFPSNELYVFFKEELYKRFDKEEELRPLEIKGYLSKDCNTFRFPTNIIRFFRELEDKEYEFIIRKVLQINEDSKKNEYLFKIDLKHLSFVLSDNWLSNKDPELSYIELK